jgi:hypothetical protein
MRAVCTVWVLCAPYWRQLVPYGSRMHCVWIMPEPCTPCWSHVGARWCHIGGEWHHKGAAWLPNGGHMEAECAVLEPHVPYGSQMEPFRRCMLPYRSSMHHTGPNWSCVCHMGGGWHYMRAAYTAWGPHGSHMGDRCSHIGGKWCQMGATCTVWRPCRSHVHHAGAMCAIWELCGRQMVPYWR